MLELIKGDTKPDLEFTITVDDVAQDLTTASTIELKWIKPDDTVETVSLTAVDLVNGEVKKVWTAGETDIVGYHRGRVVVTWSDDNIQTFPNDGSWYIWAIYSDE